MLKFLTVTPVSADEEHTDTEGRQKTEISGPHVTFTV